MFKVSRSTFFGTTQDINPDGHQVKHLKDAMRHIEEILSNMRVILQFATKYNAAQFNIPSFTLQLAQAIIAARSDQATEPSKIAISISGHKITLEETGEGKIQLTPADREVNSVVLEQVNFSELQALIKSTPAVMGKINLDQQSALATEISTSIEELDAAQMIQGQVEKSDSELQSVVGKSVFYKTVGESNTADKKESVDFRERLRSELLKPLPTGPAPAKPPRTALATAVKSPEAKKVDAGPYMVTPLNDIFKKSESTDNLSARNLEATQYDAVPHLPVPETGKVADVSLSPRSQQGTEEIDYAVPRKFTPAADQAPPLPSKRHQGTEELHYKVPRILEPATDKAAGMPPPPPPRSAKVTQTADKPTVLPPVPARPKLINNEIAKTTLQSEAEIKPEEKVKPKIKPKPALSSQLQSQLRSPPKPADTDKS